jgi:type I restriction enzyme, S subunit
MGSEWKRIPLVEVCESIVDCVNKTAPVVDYPTPFRMIRTTNIKEGRLNLVDAKYVERPTFEIWTRRAIPQKDDVLLTREAPLGEVAIIRDEAGIFLGQRIVQFRANKSVLDPRFLYYSFRGQDLQAQIHAHSGSGSTIDHIRVPDCAKFKLALPVLTQQRAIAHILGTLDDKIELNRRMNETLEAMARALFKSWFVDFDPVQAKAEGRDPGLPEHLAELFPDSFVESESGEIPAGWDVRQIYHLAEVIYGAPFKSALFNTRSHGRPLIRIRDLVSHTPQTFTTEVHPRGYLVRAGDLVVGMDGEFKAQLWHGEDAWLNQRVCCFRPTRGVPRAFVHYSIETLLQFFERSKTGTTVIHLGKSDIDTFRLLNPPRAVLEAFGKLAEPLEAELVSKTQSSRTLIALRDTLLPKLISGELRLKDAERFAAEVA